MSDVEPDEVFRHRALDLSARGAFRLLRILPSEDDSAIQCTIRITQLEKQQYTCLSYCWGDETPTHIIWIDGKAFSVRQNLFEFLITARKMNIKDELWIDAICIDQTNLQERNHQVQQMAEIYHRATRVIVYPGQVSAWTGRLIRFLAGNRWWRPFHMYDSDCWCLPALSWNPFAATIPTYLWSTSLKSVNELPYWRRLWIIQEILLAKNCEVLLSQHLVPYQRLTTTNHWEGFNAPRPGPTVPMLDRSTADAVKAESENLPGLLRLSTQAGCEDPLDRIYGILGLVQNGKTLAVDYAIDTPTLFLNVLENKYFRDVLAASGDTSSFLSPLANALGVHASFTCEICLALTQSPYLGYLRSTTPGANTTIEVVKMLLTVDEISTGGNEPISRRTSAGHWCVRCGICIQPYYATREADFIKYWPGQMERLDAHTMCVFWETVGTRRIYMPASSNQDRRWPERPWPISWAGLTHEIMEPNAITEAPLEPASAPQRTSRRRPRGLALLPTPPRPSW